MNQASALLIKLTTLAYWKELDHLQGNTCSEQPLTMHLLDCNWLGDFTSACLSPENIKLSTGGMWWEKKKSEIHY